MRSYRNVPVQPLFIHAERIMLRRTLLKTAPLSLAFPQVTMADTANRHVVVAGSGTPEILFGQEDLAKVRMVAASTFKIPLTLLALEEGIIKDIHEKVDVYPATYEPQPWWSEEMKADWGRPHSLTTAFASSAVWFFRRIAVTAGEKTVARYLSAFRYGDKNMAAGLDNFWNKGDAGVRISPLEHWKFVDYVAHRRFSLTSRTYDLARTVFIREKQGGRDVRAKTGLVWRGQPRASDLVGWYVGWVEDDRGRVTTFASLSVGRGDEIVRGRIDHASSVLKQLGAVQ